MPPKPGPSKADAAKKAKKIEDKTFGMKNKNKSKTVQTYINQISNTEQLSKEEKARRKEKEEREKMRIIQAERDALFKPVITQAKAPVGADPKSVVCAFFKEGKCTKGGKCKFSHDLAVERKAARINIHADKRDDIYKDQESFDAFMKEREGGEGKRCASDIICKHFIDAVERRQYGWVWVCPNGGDKCQYRHALPPGYKLKSELEAEKLLAQDEGPSLEDEIEAQRAALKVRTPLTYEMFLAWRERKKREAAEAEEKALRDAKEARAKGKALAAGALSGRALFTFDPTLFRDDANAGGGDDYLSAYKDKRAKEDSDGGGDEESDYGRQASAPLYDAAAQNEPLAGSDEDEGDGEELEWFCDGCEADIVGTHRYDCQQCADEFCLCEACHEAKPHEHALVRMARSRPHASSERGRALLAKDAAEAGGGSSAGTSGSAPPGISGSAVVDESLFDGEDDDDDEE